MNPRTLSLAACLLLFAIVGIVLLKPAAGPVVVDAKDAVDGLNDAERQALLNRIRNTVRERGTLETADALEIRCGLDQPTTIVFVVRDGARVKKGDALLRFDDSKLKDELAIRKLQIAKLTAAVKKAEEMLAGRKDEQAAQSDAGELTVRASQLAKSGFLAKDGEYQLALKSADAEIAIARQQLVAAEAVLKHLSSAAGSRGELAKAEAEVVAARQAVALATAKKTLLTKHTLPRKTTELDAAVARNKAESLHAKTEAASARSQAAVELQARKAELEIERSKLARVERQVRLCTVAAARDGLIVHTIARTRRAEFVPLEVGAAVRPHQSLLQLPDLKRLQVRVKANSTQVHRVRAGQSVNLRFDALPDTVFAGKVKSIAQFPQPGEWPNTDLMLYDVIITVEKPSPSLKIGMSALAEIQVTAAR